MNCVMIRLKPESGYYQVITIHNGAELREIFDNVTVHGARKVALQQADWLKAEEGLHVPAASIIYMSDEIADRYLQEAADVKATLPHIEIKGVAFAQFDVTVYDRYGVPEPETGIFNSVDEARLAAYGHANRLVKDHKLKEAAAGLIFMTDQVATDFLQEERKRRREGVITPRVTISLNSEYDIDDRYIVLSYVDGKPLQDEYMTSDLLLARQEALTRAAALLDKEAIKAEPSSRVFISDRVWSELVASLPVYVRIDNVLDAFEKGYQVSVMRGGQIELRTPVEDWESAINLATNYAQNRLGYKNPNDVILISGDVYYLKRQQDAIAALPPIRHISEDEKKLYRTMEEEQKLRRQAWNHLTVHFNGFGTMMQGAGEMRQHYEEAARRQLIHADSADARALIITERDQRIADLNRHILEVTSYIGPQLLQAWEDLRKLDEGAE